MSSLFELFSLLRRKSQIKKVTIDLAMLLNGRDLVSGLRKSGTLDNIQHVNLTAVANINQYQGGVILFTACILRYLDDIRASEMLKIRYDVDHGTSNSDFIKGYGRVNNRFKEWQSIGLISHDDAEHCRINILEKVNKLLGR